ncbi:hypothetical protein HC028_00390 [Planosporangium flavigriseum]|uniref:Glycerate kinase n=1 Tax=Planosporangium flavigriseum TaxID=373681 RepID=A0A8J3LSH2_9ACTN|nr:CoA transferase [Planosporangium flavigriseum]NJC62982.1 hypothetical protein [Planosporangium flavigriseum]GIG73149.1 hypothetical protein Pfl04_15530 [Planosporangium flavigriseum]
MTAPFTGITVLDLTHFVAGPWCTMLLADLGANVIKVEPPGRGEIARTMGSVFAGGESAIYLGFNRNKRSLALDLKTDEGREVVHRLVRTADVLVHNLRPGTAERLGVGYEQVAGLNSDLLYCHISAFGQTGPYADQPANDPIIQAISGAMLAGLADGAAPVRMGVSLPDFAGGGLAAVGITAALYRRLRSGMGGSVDVSLLGAQMFAQLDLFAGRPSDASRAVACGGGTFLVADVGPHVASELAGVSRDEALALLRASGVACAPVNTLPEVFAEPNPHTVPVRHPTVGDLAQLRSPFTAAPSWPVRVAPPPLLGEHTSEVLAELGYSAEAIEDFARRGVTGDPSSPPWRVLLAPDKFKGTLTSREAADVIAAEAERLGAVVRTLPMADGGEGTVEAFGGPNRYSVVTGPLGTPVRAGWRLVDGLAVLESAAASGLVVAGGAAANDAWAATSAGTGELIREAIDAGADEVIVGMGGSATTDGGAGALAALAGYLPFRPGLVRVITDVATPFKDAARVFGPQKGADARQVALLTRRLRRIADELSAKYGVDVWDLPRSGAAGGLAGGLAAAGAVLSDGASVIAERLGLAEQLDWADLVVTGEGRFDATSLLGKAPGLVVRESLRRGLPVLVLAGAADEGLDTDARVVTLVETAGDVAAMEDPAASLAKAARSGLHAMSPTRQER